ncbi:MAG TPA: hypothetical protein VMU25_00185 [Candidatus Paceibacterota bacterium]|nr:hypothetical protein [Candidatus Paceibacterota bacterium]
MSTPCGAITNAKLEQIQIGAVPPKNPTTYGEELIPDTYLISSSTQQ